MNCYDCNEPGCFSVTFSGEDNYTNSVSFCKKCYNRRVERSPYEGLPYVDDIRDEHIRIWKIKNKPEEKKKGWF